VRAGGNQSRWDRFLGQGIRCREEPGVKEESFFNNERTQADSLPCDGTNPTNLI